MEYSYEFKEDQFGNLAIILPEEISIFADFIQDISTTEEVDEYLGYIQNVIDGEYVNFEITLNATSVIIKKNETTVEHHYRIEEPGIHRAVVDLERKNTRNIWRLNIIIDE